MDLVFSVIMLSCSLFLLQGRNVRSLKSTSRYLGRSLLLQMSSTSVDASSKNEKALSNVRSLMDKEGIDAFVVPTDDPHMSEYTANYFARREFISGFTGSAGTVVLTKDQVEQIWIVIQYQSRVSLLCNLYLSLIERPVHRWKVPPTGR